ncbi:MAG: PspC domain-containing protein [Firmicutes bacterium]|nr:PspC domain-containing protein [Bacillota bacterium]
MKRLYRSRRDRMLGGVCAGLAEYFEIDPTIVRLLAVAAFVMTGCFPTLFAYIVAWAIVPEAPAATEEAKPSNG